VSVHQEVNVFQHGVLNGLGWVAVLTDGWILHTHWLAAAGFLLLVWSAWKILKGVEMTVPTHGFNGTTAEDLKQAAEGSYTFTKTMLPVGGLKICQDTRYYKFVPKEDMTGQEAAWTMMLFTTAVVSSRGVGITDYDYMGFVKAHGLERHFEEELS
jgi:hypothetical protein